MTGALDLLNGGTGPWARSSNLDLDARVRVENAAAASRTGPSLTVVELFGLPGSGKTTITRIASQGSTAITRPLLAAEWRRRSHLNRAGYLGRTLADVGCLAKMARFAAEAPLVTRESLRLLARIGAKAPWLRSHSGTALLDQGFLQDFWSVLFSSGCYNLRPEILAPLLRSLYRGVDLHAVFLDVDASTALARISSRSHGRSRLDGLDAAQIRGALMRAARLPRVIEEAAVLAGLKAHRLDGSHALPELAAHLQQVLTANGVVRCETNDAGSGVEELEQPREHEDREHPRDDRKDRNDP